MDHTSEWRLAPAYDLTFSVAISTMRRLARDSGVDARQVDTALAEVEAAVAP